MSYILDALTKDKKIKNKKKEVATNFEFNKDPNEQLYYQENQNQTKIHSSKIFLVFGICIITSFTVLTSILLLKKEPLLFKKDLLVQEQYKFNQNILQENENGLTTEKKNISPNKLALKKTDNLLIAKTNITKLPKTQPKTQLKTTKNISVPTNKNNSNEKKSSKNIAKTKITKNEQIKINSSETLVKEQNNEIQLISEFLKNNQNKDIKDELLLSQFKAAIKATKNSHPTQNTVSKSATSLEDLPLNIQNKIPAIKFSQHIYTTDKEKRLVKLNDKILKEGDNLNENIKILKIQPKQVIATIDNTQFALLALEDWR